jgi:hypothetical protein
MSGPWIAAFVALWALVIVLAFLVLGTLRRMAPLLERTEARLAAATQRAEPSGLQPGAIVPAFEAEVFGGGRFTDADLHGARTILLFLGPSCQACERLVDDLDTGRVPELRARLVVVAHDADEAAGFAAGGVTALVQDDRSLARVFESDRVPHAFVIAEGGTVLASGSPNDWEGVQNLLRDSEKGGGRESDIAAAVGAS